MVGVGAFIRELCGSRSPGFHRLPEMLARRARDTRTVIDTDFPAESKFDRLPSPRGVRAGSAADLAGVRPGWIAAKIDGRTIDLTTVFPVSGTKATPPGGITADAVWVGIGAAGVAVMGIVQFGEPLTAARLGCIALILLGVVGLKLLGGEA